MSTTGTRRFQLRDAPPVVVTCALTGGIHGKEANPHLPEQPDEIIEQGVAAAEAGASVLHVHARNPDGSSSSDIDIFRELSERLADSTDAIIQLTTGGSPRLTVQERFNVLALKPEMCSLNMGLLNFLVRGEEVFFANHRKDIVRFASQMAADQIKPELEIYNVSMIDEVALLIEQEVLRPPYVLNLVLNTPTQGGQRGTPHVLLGMLDAINELPAKQDEVRVNVSSMGASQLPITTIALAMGLNIRVGMEDNILWAKGTPLRGNTELVNRAVTTANILQRPIASPSEARELLGIAA